MKPYYDEDGITIYHGDCREVMRMLPNESVDILIADPPYGINYRSNMRRQSFDFIVGDKDFDACWLLEARPLVTPRAPIYVFAQDESIGPTQNALVGVGWTLQRMLVWDKMAMTAGDLNDVGSRTEYIVSASAAGASDKRRQAGRDPNLISIPRVDTRLLTHPTEKPSALMLYLLVRGTGPGEMLLDPFMGSGPTLEVAAKIGRRAIGIEIEERYCEIAAKRMRQRVLPLETA